MLFNLLADLLATKNYNLGSDFFILIISNVKGFVTIHLTCSFSNFFARSCRLISQRYLFTLSSKYLMSKEARTVQQIQHINIKKHDLPSLLSYY